MKRISHSSISVGHPLPWSVFDAGGRLLLRKGSVIQSDDQFRRLVENGIYRDTRPSQSSAEPQSDDTAPIELPLFERIATLQRHLAATYRQMLSGSRSAVEQRIRAICVSIQANSRENEDGTLAAMQFEFASDYRISHPSHAALIADTLARATGCDENTRASIVCAALTHDVGLHENLCGTDNPGPLSESQWQEIRKHPQRSADILSRNGIDDPVWLEAVMHHHERLAGTGYPHGLTGSALSVPARILAIADIYSAVVRPRPHREAKSGKKALQEIFLERGEGVDPALVALLVKHMGIYPPGSLVRLRNGEVGVVASRGAEAHLPIVYSLINAKGQPSARPVHRDATLIEEVLPSHRYKSLWGPIQKLFCTNGASPALRAAAL